MSELNRKKKTKDKRKVVYARKQIIRGHSDTQDDARSIQRAHYLNFKKFAQVNLA